MEIKKQQEFSINNFKVDALQEIKNKEEEQLRIVNQNPFIEIVDNDTFTNAKKNRTALVSARTSLEKEKTNLIKKIKEKITIPVSLKYDEFIEITKPHEDKQQAEVRRWEDIKESERKEKLRLEEERKEKHRSTIKTIVDTISEEIKNLDFETSLSYKVLPIYNGEEIDPESLEEFSSKLTEELESLKFTLSTRKETLKQQEEIRAEKLRLENERKENERVNNHKQTISDFYKEWINKIYTASFQTVFNLEEEFINEDSHNVEEFQSEYASKRAELVKEFEQRKSLLNSQEEQRLTLEKQQQEQKAEAKRIADEKAKAQAEIEAKQKSEQERIQKENDRLEAEKQALQKEKDELLKSQRITALKNLGFDNDLVLNLEHCKIIFPLEDVLCPEEEFQDLLNNAKYQIENPPATAIEETVQKVETKEEIILNEGQIIQQTLLNDFCDYSLSKHGYIDKEFITDFILNI